MAQTHTANNTHVICVNVASSVWQMSVQLVHWLFGMNKHGLQNQSGSQIRKKREARIRIGTNKTMNYKMVAGKTDVSPNVWKVKWQ